LSAFSSTLMFGEETARKSGRHGVHFIAQCVGHVRCLFGNKIPTSLLSLSVLTSTLGGGGGAGFLPGWGGPGGGFGLRVLGCWFTGDV